MEESRLLIDSIIDESLELQENMHRQRINRVVDFAKVLDKIINFESKVTSSLYEQLTEHISIISQKLKTVKTQPIMIEGT